MYAAEYLPADYPSSFKNTIRMDNNEAFIATSILLFLKTCDEFLIVIRRFPLS